MPADLQEFLKMLLPAFIGAGGAYAAIRADLAKLTERATTAMERAKEAHDRIDGLMRDSRGGGD